MKLKDFKKKMEKGLFTTAEAQVVAFKNNPLLTNLQLHQWGKNGDIIRLKRGVYMFADAKPAISDIAKNLYFPCYFSLEYILSLNNIIPEAVFTYTLVTTKPTRMFKTPLGNFSFRKIKREAFTGFDAETLMAEKDKAFVDYFYLNSSRLKEGYNFWEESRLEAVETELNFKKIFHYAKLFNSKKLIYLLKNFENYAKSYQNHP